MRTVSRLYNLLLIILCVPAFAVAQQKYEPVSFSKVNITDDFWKPKLDKVATATLAACIDQTESKTPRIRNFEKVANRTGEKHEGIFLSSRIL